MVTWPLLARHQPEAVLHDLQVHDRLLHSDLGVQFLQGVSYEGRPQRRGGHARQESAKALGVIGRRMEPRTGAECQGPKAKAAQNRSSVGKLAPPRTHCQR